MCTQIEAIGKGKAEISKLGVILGNSYLDTRMERCALINMVLLKLEYAGEARARNANLAKYLGTKEHPKMHGGLRRGNK